jgi:hypothetical protein
LLGTRARLDLHDHYFRETSTHDVELAHRSPLIGGEHAVASLGQKQRRCLLADAASRRVAETIGCLMLQNPLLEKD